MPIRIIPQIVLANAEYVSQIDLGTSDFAPFAFQSHTLAFYQCIVYISMIHMLSYFIIDKIYL